MDYRSFYFEKVGSYDFKMSFDIHHIDGNRRNNKIENLVALPTEIHRLYHLRHSDLWPIDKFKETKGILTKGHRYLPAAFELLRKYMDIHNVVCQWIDYRDFKLGLLPNVHNI